MLIRLRTNLGGCRLEIKKDPANWTVAQLKKLVIDSLSITDRAVQLSFDLEGSCIIGPDSQSLESLSITHGREIFLVGRYQKTVVEKSYVDTDGNVVSAGINLSRIDADANLIDVVATSSLEETSTTPAMCNNILIRNQAANLSTTDKDCTSTNTKITPENAVQNNFANASADADISVPQSPPPSAFKSDFALDYQYDEEDHDNAAGDSYFGIDSSTKVSYMDGVRAPDAPKRMTLLGGDDNNNNNEEGGRFQRMSAFELEVRHCILFPR